MVTVTIVSYFLLYSVLGTLHILFTPSSSLMKWVSLLLSLLRGTKTWSNLPKRYHLKDVGAGYKCTLLHLILPTRL